MEPKIKKLLSVLIILTMIIALLPAGKARADEEAEGSTGETHYIAVASDRHGDEEAVVKALTGMPDSVEYVCMDGDMAGDTDGEETVYNYSTIFDEVQSVFTEIDPSHVSILCGEHDAGAVDDSGVEGGMVFGAEEGSSQLMYTGYNEDGTAAYYIYAVAYYDMYSRSLAETSEAAFAFMDWVDTVKDNSIPIVVISHIPLHYAGGDNGYAAAWNMALNYAATGAETTEEGADIIRNVVYLYGHNHTAESNYEYYIPAGAAMKLFDDSCSSYIYYEYVTAGYLRDRTAATLIGIDGENITITKYQDGSIASTFAGEGAKTDFSDTYYTEAVRVITRVKPEFLFSYEWVLNEDGGYTVTGTAVPLDESGYTVVETVEAVKEIVREPGCEEQGEIRYTAEFEDEVFAVQTRSFFLDALGHDLVHHDRVEPTKTTVGYEEYWECTRCGKLFSDAEGTHEIEAPV
nr:hypothetical protein [Lachnospiraceae bacterium]